MDENKTKHTCLNNAEINVLEKLARRSKMDSWFRIDEHGHINNPDEPSDSEQTDLLTFFEGLTDYDLEILEKDELITIVNLLTNII